MNNDYLEHHGIKGMKWGVRRNNTLGGSGGVQGPKPPKKGVSVDGLKTAKKLVDASSDTVNEGKRINSEVKKISNDSKQKQNKQKMVTDMSKISDKELQQIVNRLNMEERYSSVMNSRQTNSGRDRVGKILDNTGTALAVGSSILSIILAMKELKK